MFTLEANVPHRPTVHVEVGGRGVHATGVGDRSITLLALHDEVCRQLRARAPYPIGPIRITALQGRRIVMDARRLPRR